MIEFTPTEAEVGERIDVVLTKRSGVPRKFCQAALRAGQITVGGRPVRPSHRLEAGDLVSGSVAEPPPELPEAENISIEVRWEDERLLVISKPAGLVTHPGHGHTSGTLVSALLNLGGPLAGADGIRPGIVHRLDKDTSGLLLVAKDDETQEFLIEAIKRREVERNYLALVRGRPGSASGTIDAPLGRHPRRRTVMAVVPGGKPAVTHWTTLALSEAATLLEIKLETGRTHQIRVHLAHLGHPVVGDVTYGGRADLARALGLQRPFLHARRIVFPHPVDGRRIQVDDPLPSDLAEVLEQTGMEIPPEAPQN